MQGRKSTVLYLVVGLAILIAGVWAYAGTALTGLSPGRPLPHSVLVDLKGQRVPTSDLVGRPLVLRFSSVGCNQCSQDFQWLEQLARANDQVAVVAVQVEDDIDDLQRVLGADFNPGYAVLIDAEGQMAKNFGLRWLPATYFVDGDGMLVGSIWGEVQQHSAELQHFLQQINP